MFIWLECDGHLAEANDTESKQLHIPWTSYTYQLS